MTKYVVVKIHEIIAVGIEDARRQAAVLAGHDAAYYCVEEGGIKALAATPEAEALAGDNYQECLLQMMPLGPYVN